MKSPVLLPPRRPHITPKGLYVIRLSIRELEKGTFEIVIYCSSQIIADLKSLLFSIVAVQHLFDHHNFYLSLKPLSICFKTVGDGSEKGSYVVFEIDSFIRMVIRRKIVSG